ncbi:hypothetical protein KEJ36_02760 [Candidatus Bathyarchaeota archaeon]|nr:hypothetical protein [Candidatus Bathyarchaeota archaeon]
MGFWKADRLPIVIQLSVKWRLRALRSVHGGQYDGRIASALEPCSKTSWMASYPMLSFQGLQPWMADCLEGECARGKVCIDNCGNGHAS